MARGSWCSAWTRYVHGFALDGRYIVVVYETAGGEARGWHDQLPLVTHRLDTQRPTHDNEAPHGLVVVSRARPSQQAAAILGAAQTMASALDGITVLDLTDGPAGALTTMFLCDHGARVIRVVDINDTAPRHGGYLVWDRGKECIQLDFSRIVPPAQGSYASATDTPTASRGSVRSPMNGCCVLPMCLLKTLPPPHATRRWCPSTGYLPSIRV